MFHPIDKPVSQANRRASLLYNLLSPFDEQQQQPTASQPTSQPASQQP